MIRHIENPEWVDDDRRTVDYFTRLNAAHGIHHRALDWASAESQRARFERLAAIADLRGTSVLDVGCGQGDFLSWLREQRVACRYQGVDLTPAMIDACRRRFPDAEFAVGSATRLPFGEGERFDFVVAGGIFYRRTIEPDRFMRQAIEHCFAHCRRGLAFNTLSTWGDRPDPGEFRADPAVVLEFCRSLTRRVVLDHGYHFGDFTIRLYREGSVD
jgi:SAM-dependent methyltransferase